MSVITARETVAATRRIYYESALFEALWYIKSMDKGARRWFNLYSSWACLDRMPHRFLGGWHIVYISFILAGMLYAYCEDGFSHYETKNTTLIEIILYNVIQFSLGKSIMKHVFQKGVGSDYGCPCTQVNNGSTESIRKRCQLFGDAHMHF